MPTVSSDCLRQPRLCPRGPYSPGVPGEALDSEMSPFPWYEFVQMLYGEVTITEEDGTTHIFKAGDAFFTPKGTVCSWKVNEYVKKFYAILDPPED